MEKLKKMLPIIGIVAVILLIIVSFFIGEKDDSSVNSEISNSDVSEILKNAQDESSKITDEEKKDFENINVDTYLEYYNGSEKKIIFIGRPTCPYCEIAEPIVKKISKDYDLDIYYLNTDNFVDDDEDIFVNSDEFLKGGYGTPMLFIVSNGSIVDKIDELTDTSHYIEFFKKNNIIS